MPTPGPGKHDPYAALRSPNYRRFASGFVVSSMGLQMLATAIGWEIYSRTNDPLALGYIGLARALPVVVCALPAGYVIDHFSRKWALVLTQIGMGVAAAFLAVASYEVLPVWVMYVVLAVMGCARSFNGPSRATLLPMIVGPDEFHNAVTWNSGFFQASAMLGPIIAGLMIAAFKVEWPVYACTAVGCWVFALSSLGLQPRASTKQAVGMSFRGMFAGAGHVWREKTILSTLTLDLFAVLLGGATAMMPIYARDILKVGPEGMGALRSAPYVGAFLMAMVLAHRPPFKRAGAALLWSVAGFGAATIVFGVSESFVLSLVMLFIAGAVDNVSVVVRHVLVQVRTPDHLRGRVSSVNSVFIESSNELGAFESGLVARLFGPVVSVVSGGIGTILVVLAVARIWPELRRLGELRLGDPPVVTPPVSTPGEASPAS
jgi:MFS family permease